jgi:magnesium transporter
MLARMEPSAQMVIPRRLQALHETLRKFLRRGTRANISKLLAKLRPEDAAQLLRGLGGEDQHEVFSVLVADFPEQAGEVLTDLEPPQRLALLERLSPEQIAGILERIAVDDAVFLVESLPLELHDRVLEMVDLRNLPGVQDQLSYRGDSAGRIMDPDFFALPEATTVRAAIAAIQEARDVEMIFYLYVVDEDGRLAGVTSLRQLLLTPPDKTLQEIMSRSVIKVSTETDQEEVAQLAARYDLLAIPVTDERSRLVGIVTVDDIIDVVKEEATEDFYKLAGTSDDELLYAERSFKVARIRLPWLLLNLAGLLLTGLLLKHFQVTLKEALFLLTFVPVVMGMGGNIGSQTATIAVRGLATGRLGAEAGGEARFLWQQLKVAVALGFASSAVVAVAASFLEQNLYYSLVVGVSLLLAVTVAAANGVAIPVLFKRLGIDPAVASAPLVATTNDIIGILIFYGLASLLIDFLVR